MATPGSTRSMRVSPVPSLAESVISIHPLCGSSFSRSLSEPQVIVPNIAAAHSSAKPVRPKCNFI